MKNSTLLKMPAKRGKNYKPTIFVCVAIVVAILFIAPPDWQAMSDASKASQFTPTTQVENLANGIDLTKRGKDILYATSPQIKNKDSFNASCGSNGDRKTFILGCYYEKNGDEYIDIFNSGATASSISSSVFNYDYSKKVTMAHEMLHAAYSRLGNGEKLEVNDLLDTVYNSNKELRDEIGLYSPSQKYDELYARAGTEVRSLPVRLEEHYAKYFYNRVAVVGMYEKNKS